jgi:hypothetical protein
MTNFINQLLIHIFFIVSISCFYSNSWANIPLKINNARYFDSTNGDDKNDGLTPETPWRSLDRLNQISCLPGTSIHLKAGSKWQSAIALQGSGSAKYPIIIDSYGKGDAPKILGNGRSNYTLKLENQQYWELKNLDISNYHGTEENVDLQEWELFNASYWAKGSALPQDTAKRIRKSAILILAKDVGELKHLHFSNLEVHGVNGDISDKDNGGIFFEITGNKTPTWFTDILIEHCYIHDVDRTGISNRSSWNKRTLHTNINWTPSKNIIIKNNTFERTGANALIIREAQAPMVEHNLFDHCAIKHTGNASFPFNCDDALWQYNEARFTKYNKGDVDAGGFDSDYRCKNTVIRYNFSHDNEYGGVLVCCKGGNETRFNVGTHICYNIFANNKKHVFRISGEPNNTKIYNNVIYNADDAEPVEIIWHKNWNGYPSNTTYSNNIFYAKKQSLSINLSQSTNTNFQNNIFYGTVKGYLPINQIQTDPLFDITDLKGTPLPKAFKVKPGSPAIHGGIIIEDHPDIDFFGNKIRKEEHPNIGIYNYSSFK